MGLEGIYEPINNLLEQVRKELIKIEEELDSSPARAVFKHFFQTRGKLLRPALLLLSAGVINSEELDNKSPVLIQAAVAVELIHNASLIHDDIVDNDMFRRGTETLNNLFGDKVAALAGDALFARAISITLEVFPKETANKMIQMVRRMSTIEMQQRLAEKKSKSGEAFFSSDKYFELIHQKTALLMSTACLLGAELVTADKTKIEILESYGSSFGMTYQLVDDLIDQDPISIKYASSEDIKSFAHRGFDSLDKLEASIFKEKLIELLQYIMSRAHIEAEEMTKK